MKKGKKTMMIVALLIAVVLIVVIITAVISSNRKQQKGHETEQAKEEFTASLDGKYAENDNVKISIDGMSYVGNHLIIKYDVKSKDGVTNLFENANNELDEFDFHLNRKIKINSETIDAKDDLTDQISYKKSDTEVIVYDVIELENIPDDIDLQVKFFENDYTALVSENEDGATIDEAEEDDETDDEETEVVDNTDDVVDEEFPEDTSVEYNEEDATEDDVEEVETEYNGEQSEAEIEEEKSEKAENDSADTEEIGSIKVKTTRKNLEQDTDIVEITDGYQAQNVTIEGEKLIKTPMGAFLVVESTIDNVDYSKIDSQESGDPSIYRIDVKDENGNSIKQGSNQYVEYDDGETVQIDENSKNIKATIKSIILLTDSDKENMEVEPYYLTK